MIIAQWWQSLSATAEARKPRWRRRVESLRCLKGVDTATAADLVFEAGEFSRFRNARSFAAWVGLTPSEHSSGESDRRGAITKAGNKHLRKTLVEAAWHYMTCSGRPKDLAKGQVPDPAARRHAAKGVRRLVDRREALLARTDCRFDVEASAVATDCPARDRHGRILNCKDERR